MLVFQKSQKGEISLGLGLFLLATSLVGLIASYKAVQTPTNLLPKAQQINCTQLTQYPNRDCNTTIEGPCSFGQWSFDCTNNTCPTDTGIRVGLPYWCDGTKWYLMNTYGECTNQCSISQPTNTPAPTSPASGRDCNYNDRSFPEGYCSPTSSDVYLYCANSAWVSDPSNNRCPAGSLLCIAGGFPKKDYPCCVGDSDDHLPEGTLCDYPRTVSSTSTPIPTRRPTTSPTRSPTPTVTTTTAQNCDTSGDLCCFSGTSHWCQNGLTCRYTNYLNSYSYNYYCLYPERTVTPIPTSTPRAPTSTPRPTSRPTGIIPSLSATRTPTPTRTRLADVPTSTPIATPTDIPRPYCKVNNVSVNYSSPDTCNLNLISYEYDANAPGVFGLSYKGTTDPTHRPFLMLNSRPLGLGTVGTNIQQKFTAHTVADLSQGSANYFEICCYFSTHPPGHPELMSSFTENYNCSLSSLCQIPGLPTPTKIPTNTPTSSPTNTPTPTPDHPVPTIINVLPSPVQPTLVANPQIAQYNIDRINYLLSIKGENIKILLCAKDQKIIEWLKTQSSSLVNADKIEGFVTEGNIPNHLSDNNFFATTHEDLPETRNYSCYPNCQFWLVEKFSYSSDGFNKIVLDHEKIHNQQSNNDDKLAEHVRGEGGRQTINNKAYMSLIEGFADTQHQTAQEAYLKYRTFYQKLKEWSETQYLGAKFELARNGYWDDFLEIKASYENTSGKSIADLLKESGWSI